MGSGKGEWERDRQSDGRRGAGGRRVAAGCVLALLREREAGRVQEHLRRKTTNASDLKHRTLDVTLWRHRGHLSAYSTSSCCTLFSWLLWLGSVARSEKEGRREAGTNVKTLSEKGRWAGVEQGREAGTDRQAAQAGKATSFGRRRRQHNTAQHNPSNNSNNTRVTETTHIL